MFRRWRTKSLPVADWERVVGEIEGAAALHRANGWDVAPAQYHRTPTAPQDARVVSGRVIGLDFEHLQFKSGYTAPDEEPGGERWNSYAPCTMAHAWLRRRPDAGRRWLICVPGYGMGAPLVDLTAFDAARLGRELEINVAVPVLPLHGPRRTGWMSGDGFFAGDCLDTLHAQAQAVWDVRRLIAWIRAEGGRAIGVYGLSLGGYTTALLAALEPRLACVVAGIPASDFVDLAPTICRAGYLPTRCARASTGRWCRISTASSRPSPCRRGSRGRGGISLPAPPIASCRSHRRVASGSTGVGRARSGIAARTCRSPGNPSCATGSTTRCARTCRPRYTDASGRLSTARRSHSIVHDRREHSPPPSGRRRHGGPRSARQLLADDAGARASLPARCATARRSAVLSLHRSRSSRAFPAALWATAGTEARAPPDNCLADDAGARASLPARCATARRSAVLSLHRSRSSRAFPAALRAAAGTEARAPPDNCFADAVERASVERGRPCPLGARQRAGARCSHSIVRDRREHSPPPSGRRRARRPALRQRRISRRRRGAVHATARRARIFICVIRGSPAARAARCAGLCPRAAPGTTDGGSCRPSSIR